MPGPRRGFVLAIAYTVLAVWSTWPVAGHLSDSLISLGDPLDSVWRIGWGEEALLHRPLHILDSPVSYPFPRSYLFDELLLGPAILALPLRLFSRNPVAIYNAALLATLALNALAAYALARRIGCGTMGGFAAGLVYAFAPLRMGHILHVGLLSAQYFPLAILLLDDLFEGAGWWTAVALAGVLAMQALSSQYFGFHMLVAVGLLVLMRFVRRGPKEALRPPAVWVKVGAAAVLALLPVLPIAVAYVDVQHHHRFSRSIDENGHNSATLTSFVTPPPSNWLWGSRAGEPPSLLQTTAPFTDESSMFLGLLAPLLAVLGMVVGWRRALPRYLVVLGAVSVVLALGPALRSRPGDGVPLVPNMPYRLLYEHVPGFDSMRAPGRIAVLYCLSLACLSGLGLTWLERRAGTLGPALASSVLAVLCLECRTRPLVLSPIEVGERVPKVYEWLKRQEGAVVVELPFVGEGNVRTRYQYFSLFDGRRLVNSASSLQPVATKLLAEELANGPTALAIATLRALGVTHVVVHNDLLPPEISQATAEQLRPGRIIATFGGDVVYGLAPGGRFDTLRQSIPEGSTVLLLGREKDPLAAYLAALAWLLHDRRVCSDLPFDFGQGYACQPSADTRYGYALGARGAGKAYCRGEVVWEDDFARACRPPGTP